MFYVVRGRGREFLSRPAYSENAFPRFRCVVGARRRGAFVYSRFMALEIPFRSCLWCFTLSGLLHLALLPCYGIIILLIK